MSKKIVLDSVHGTISLDNVLFSIIDTAEFQRMRYIKQLETITYLYPSAGHTRFEHSIGTCHVAGRFVEHLQKEQPEMKIDNRDVLCVKIAGLCHDLGHGPYSHMFEEVIKRIHMEKNPKLTEKQAKKFFEHEKASLLIFDRIFDKMQNCDEFRMAHLTTQDREFIKELIKPTIVPKMAQYYKDMQSTTNKPTIKTYEKKIEELNKKLQTKCGRSKEKAFLTEIVSNWRNHVDVDKWDYFARDAFHLGITITFDPVRYICNSRIINPDISLNQICVRDKELRNVYEMFRTRIDLYNRAYQHSKCVGLKEMMIDILMHLEPFYDFYDIVSNLSASTLDRYLELDDRAIVLTKNFLTHRLNNLSDVEREGCDKAKSLLERMEMRRLYKCVARLIVNDDAELTASEAMRQLFNAANGRIQRADFVIVELKVNFGNGNRDPVENLKFFEKKNFEIVPKEDIPEYQSNMRPRMFQDRWFNFYLKNEALYDKSDLVETLTTLFKEICSKNN